MKRKKIEVNLKEIAQCYKEYMQKYQECAARLTDGTREYCSVSPIDGTEFPCPYVDTRYSCYRKSENRHYFGCAYLKKCGV